MTGVHLDTMLVTDSSECCDVQNVGVSASVGVTKNAAATNVPGAGGFSIGDNLMSSEDSGADDRMLEEQAARVMDLISPLLDSADGPVVPSTVGDESLPKSQAWDSILAMAAAAASIPEDLDESVPGPSGSWGVRKEPQGTVKQHSKVLPVPSGPPTGLASTGDKENITAKNTSAAAIIAGSSRVLRRNAVRLEVIDNFSMNRHLFSRLVVQSALGFGISQLDAIFSLPGGKVFEIVFVNYPSLLQFWERWEKLKNQEPLNHFSVEALSEKGVVNVTLQMYCEVLKNEDIVTWLSRSCKVLGPVVHIRDEDGIKTGARTVKVKLESDPIVPGGLRHLPGKVSIGPFRGFLHDPGQVKTCNRCGSTDHMAWACRTPKCYKCGSLEHSGQVCTKPLKCSLCGSPEHLFRLCPKSFANKVKSTREFLWGKTNGSESHDSTLRIDKQKEIGVRQSVAQSVVSPEAPCASPMVSKVHSSGVGSASSVNWGESIQPVGENEQGNAEVLKERESHNKSLCVKGNMEEGVQIEESHTPLPIALVSTDTEKDGLEIEGEARGGELTASSSTKSIWDRDSVPHDGEAGESWSKPARRRSKKERVSREARKSRDGLPKHRERSPLINSSDG